MTIKYEFALNVDKEIISISDAKKNTLYFCANKQCKGEMIAKLGNIRAHHFAHKFIDTNHEGESILHYNTKMFIYNRLHNVIKKKSSLFIKVWQCCHDIISIDISKDCSRVGYEEYLSEAYKPDITIYDHENKPIFVIEIIITSDRSNIGFIIDNNVRLIKVYTSLDFYRDLSDNKLYLIDNVLFPIVYPHDEHVKLLNFGLDISACGEWRNNQCYLREHALELIQELKERIKERKRINKEFYFKQEWMLANQEDDA